MTAKGKRKVFFLFLFFLNDMCIARKNGLVSRDLCVCVLAFTVVSLAFFDIPTC